MFRPLLLAAMLLSVAIGFAQSPPKTDPSSFILSTNDLEFTL
ncbi:MAG: hypothetical protein SNJ82_03220 [Gemmataceae bacterium]